MRKIIIITTILLFGQVCFGQTNETIVDTIKWTESLLNLPDTIIGNEIASFSIKGSSIIKADNFNKSDLVEIPLKGCTDSSAYFEKGNFYASEIIVGIYSENKFSKHRIEKVKFIHVKYGLTLPDSAISGLYDPIFCLNNSENKKELLSNCKVFRSSDKKRVYIYMLNGNGTSRYEVTWIIQDSKYYGRIVDYAN